MSGDWLKSTETAEISLTINFPDGRSRTVSAYVGPIANLTDIEIENLDAKITSHLTRIGGLLLAKERPCTTN
jgi:hypothetical protein